MVPPPPPRSVADATRFTPTGPHAFTRTPMSAATASAGETPQQRVARLREAARRAKLDQISTVDRIIDRGRIWADKAHRFVAISLIGATVLCGGITIFATIDMVLYTRRKKRAYHEEQKALRAADAAAAANNESGILAAVATPTTPARDSSTLSDKLKTWALSGLTPAEKEEEIRRQNMESHTAKDDILSQPSTNDPVREERAKGGSAGVLSSITGWWSRR